MQEDEENSAVHYNGLRQMVSVRGGLEAFTDIKSLQRVIAWYVLRSRLASATIEIDFYNQGSKNILVEMERPIRTLGVVSFAY